MLGPRMRLLLAKALAIIRRLVRRFIRTFSRVRRRNNPSDFNEEVKDVPRLCSPNGKQSDMLTCGGAALALALTKWLIVNSCIVDETQCPAAESLSAAVEKPLEPLPPSIVAEVLPRLLEASRVGRVVAPVEPARGTEFLKADEGEGYLNQASFSIM